MKISAPPICIIAFALILPVSCGVRKAPVSEAPVVGETKAPETAAIYSSQEFSVLSDRIVQGKFQAVAKSRTSLASNYQSPANENMGVGVTLKFSINGKDNEMTSGKDHQVKVIAENGVYKAPLIKFGQLHVDTTKVPAGTYLKPDTRLVLSLDMREVLSQMNTKGYYSAFNGTKIYKDDFKGVYVAGGTSPLTWDFDNLANYPHLELKDPDKDGIYTLELLMNEQAKQEVTASSWTLTKDVSAFPQYRSDYPIVDALYNLALEEMQNAVEPDSTFRTGKEWAGVWTRDISYSIILSMATLQPKVAMYSLMRKVRNQRVIQDTGTGGSYPVSSDRMIWAVAAWEVYKNTGDRAWLEKAYPIIKNSVEDDLVNVYDPATGLVKGESSFLDWREQTYPEWMQPADIYESENLGTNAVHYQTNIVLAEMARLMNDGAAAKKYTDLASGIKAGINKHLWLAGKGYYGQFLYGRNYKILSPRAEALGEALTVLFDIADPERQKQIVAGTPVNAFGIPCIYPQIPGIPPYHNNAVWPFVQSYWAMAAAKTGNAGSVLQSMATIYRPAGLFLTNKENFVATNGDFKGTQINSSNMLWSLSGNIALVYKVLFGMNFHADSIEFKPLVPKALSGTQVLSNYRYRGAVLEITMKGFGNRISSFSVDGKRQDKAIIPASLKGSHKIMIELDNREAEDSKTNLVTSHFSPATPEATYTSGVLSWKEVPGAAQYKVLKNGVEMAPQSGISSAVEAAAYGEYQVIAIDSAGTESFASEPIAVAPEKHVKIIELETIIPKASRPYKGFTGKGFVEIDKGKNSAIDLNLDILESGTYAIDFRYSNGNGPTNTDNKCAIRSLRNDREILGTFVFPQRGKDEWSDWGYSNSVKVKFEKGKTSLRLEFIPANENMNGLVNQAMLDHVRVTRLE